MAIPTSRTQVSAQIDIDIEKCTGCCLCVSVCKDFSLELANKKARVTTNPIFGCIACGHCIAICPEDAIRITGREMSPNDVFKLPANNECSSYKSLLYLMQKRRSIREFTDEEVSQENIDAILEFAKTAPMGLPPTDVHVLVLKGKEKVSAFSRDFCKHLESMKWFVSGWFLTLMRPFWGKDNDRMFRNFVRPVFKIYINGMKQGKNYLSYDAPLMFYFYGSPYSDPADPIVACTYAMQAAEAQGLGSCMLGAIHPLMQNGRSAAALRKKYGILNKSREGLFLIVGHSAVKYRKSIKRSFACVSYC